MSAPIGTEHVFRATAMGYPLDRIQKNRSKSWDVYLDEQHVATVRTEQEARDIIMEATA